MKLFITSFVLACLMFVQTLPAADVPETPAFQVGELSLELFTAGHFDKEKRVVRSKVEDHSDYNNDKDYESGDLEPSVTRSIGYSSEDLWGGGVGMTYFPAEVGGVQVGFYGQGTALDNNGLLVDQAQGGLVIRLPIQGLRVAPYVRGGAGYNFEQHHNMAAVASGINWRPKATGRFSVFVECGHQWDDHDNWVGRGGVSILLGRTGK